MRKFNKVLSLILSAGVLVGLASCGNKIPGNSNGGNSGTPSESSATEDPDKTNIKLCYYNGGLRDVWIKNAIAEFENTFADYSFESDKKGVKVTLDSAKDHRGPNYLINAKDTDFSMFMLEDVDYYEYRNKGHLASIKNVVTNKAITGVENGQLVSSEEKTIEEKMYPDAKTYYNVNNDYYALPFHASTLNLNYNVELFENYGLYFAKGKTAEGMTDAELEKNLVSLFTSDLNNLSDGPDGVHGTYDDGLPATFADMNALIKYMKVAKITPFIWTGKSNFYITLLANAVWADIIGADEVRSFLSLSGDADDLCTLDANGNIVYDAGKIKTVKETLTGDTAYKFHLSEGKLHALEFVEMIFEDSNNYYFKSVNGGFTHLDAQKFFIKGGTSQYPNIGFLIDGSWWDSEGRDYFDTVGDKTYLKRKYGIMPIPKIDASHIGEKETKLISCTSSVFLNSNLTGAKKTAAETFMSWLHSDKALAIFTKETAIMREFKYALSDSDLAAMSYYGRVNYGIFNNEKVDVVAYRPLSDSAVRNASILHEQRWGFSTGKSNSVADMIYTDKMTAEQIFKAVYTYYSTNWNTIYQKS